MLANIISFILGFFVCFIILALAKASDDSIERIILLKELWFRFKNNDAKIEELDEAIKNL